MDAIITIRPGTRNHDVRFGNQTLPIREQSRAIGTARALVRAGVVDSVTLVTE